jgi:hypothetical protein
MERQDVAGREVLDLRHEPPQPDVLIDIAL